MAQSDYRFSFGPWNIHEGADPFGPTVRPTVAFAEKLKQYKKLGFDGVQFHDDDAVPDVDKKTAQQVEKEAKELKKVLDGEGLVAEFAAPRLWEDPRGVDGGFTANDAKARQWALDRTKRCMDICNHLGTDFMVLWLAREGSYVRESKNAIDANRRVLDALDALLDHDPKIRIAIEPKPNEPTDQAYVPTIGHALALAAVSKDPKRVGGLIETAHAILAGLDASDEMAFALSMGKLWSVHLNDQNGLKFDEDKSFGAANLRAAYNQVRVLELGGYPATGNFVGLDVSAITLSSGAGAISLTGTGGIDAATGGHVGVRIRGAAVVQSTTGSITLNGTGGAGTTSGHGAEVSGGASVTTATGAINITGVANGSGASNWGVNIVGSGTQVASTGASGAGSISIDGTGGNGTTNNYGVRIGNTQGSVTSVSGNIVITGHAGNGSGISNIGVIVEPGGIVSSSGSATVSINGTGGGASGGTGNGVQIWGDYGGAVTGAEVSSASGAITITGTGSAGASMNGIVVGGLATITSTGAAPITLDGRASGSGLSINYVSTADTLGGSPSGGSVTLATTIGNATIDGVVGGTGMLIKSGPATATLSAANTYSGGTRIEAGTLSVNADGRLGAVPGAASAGNVTFAGGTLATTATFSLSTNRGIALSGSGTIDVAGGTTLTYAGLATGSGALTKAGAGELVVGGASTYSGGTTLSAGTLSLAASTTGAVTSGPLGTGALSLVGGTLRTADSTARTLANATTYAGNFTIGGSGALTLSGAQTLTGNRTVTVSNSALTTFSGTINADAATNNRTLAYSAAGSDMTFSGAIGGAQALLSFTVSNSQTTTLGAVTTRNATGGAISVTATRNILVNGNLTSNNRPITLSANAAGTSAGNFVGLDISAATVSSGTGAINLTGRGGTDAATGSHYGIRVQSAAVVQSSSGTITVNGTGGSGTSANSGVGVIGTNSRIATTTSGAINITGTGGPGTSTANRGVYVASGGVVTSASGAVNITGTGGGTGAGTSSNLGIWIEDGSVTSTGTATVTLNGTGGVGSTAWGVLVRTSAHGVSSVNGAISITGTGMTSGSHGVRIDNFAGVTSSGTASILLDGVGAGSGFSVEATTGTTIGGGSGVLTVTTTATDAPISATINVGGLVKQGAAAANMSGAAISTGSVTLSAGTLVPPSTGAFTVTGSWTNDASPGALTAASGTVSLAGSSTQTVGGSFGTTFSGLTVNNSAGVSLSSSITVNGTLTFTSGNIITSANMLSIASTGSVSRTSGHVVGNLRKHVPTGNPTPTFEVGSATAYTPVALAFSGVTVAGDLTAATATGDHPSLASSSIAPTMSVNRYWTLTNGGLTFTTFSATFTFVAADLDGSTNTALFMVDRYSGGAWGAPETGNRTATTTQATGLGDFGDFAIGEPTISPPSGLAATPISTRRIDLAWTDNAAGETGYAVELSTNGTTYSPLASLAADSVAYSATGLSPSTTYTFRVRATAGSIASPWVYAAAATLAAPLATGDSYTTVEDGTLTIAAPGLRANDPDGTNPSFSASKVSDPLHGTVVVNADGSFTYVPDATFAGSDSFTYRLSDGELGGDPVTVSIEVVTSSFVPAAAWPAAPDPSRYLELSFPAYVPGDATVHGASLTHRYRPATPSDTTCYYVLVHAAGQLIASHGSAATPVSCQSGQLYRTDVILMPEVDTPTEANALTVRLVVWSTGGGRSHHRLASLAVDYHLD